MIKLEPLSLSENLKIENAKEQLEHLKKIDSDWEDLDFLVDLIVWKEASGNLKACLMYNGAEQKAGVNISIFDFNLQSYYFYSLLLALGTFNWKLLIM